MTRTLILSLAALAAFTGASFAQDSNPARDSIYQVQQLGGMIEGRNSASVMAPVVTDENAVRASIAAPGQVNDRIGFETVDLSGGHSSAR